MGTVLAIRKEVLLPQTGEGDGEDGLTELECPECQRTKFNIIQSGNTFHFLCAYRKCRTEIDLIRTAQGGA